MSLRVAEPSRIIRIYMISGQVSNQNKIISYLSFLLRVSNPVNLVNPVNHFKVLRRSRSLIYLFSVNIVMIYMINNLQAPILSSSLRTRPGRRKHLIRLRCSRRLIFFHEGSLISLLFNQQADYRRRCLID